MDSNIVFSVYEITRMFLLFSFLAPVVHFISDYLYHAFNGF